VVRSERQVVRSERQVVRGERAAPPVAPAAPAAMDGLGAAYDLLQAGQYEQARQAYEKLRIAQPDNPDVLLGLAVIAQNRNHTEQAAQLYLRVIELDPRNGYAQAGLVGLIGRADPAAAEAKLKQLIAQQPAAYPQFALGNLYAAQGRWSEAQAAYFEAYRLEPDAADYAFNLAVSLEHIGQPRSAAEYYQRALRLAQGAAVHFDPAQARSRLQQLSR
jgi:tetratricopeptide (TPR) repeat protein